MASVGLTELSFLGGLLAGFASSLHCVGMCGGIAASLSISLGGQAGTGQARALMLAQTGRILAYVSVGSLLAVLGSQAYLEVDRATAHLVLRWAAAMVLVYIGLSVAGWAPSLAGLDRLGVRVVGVLQAPFRGALAQAGPVAAGFVWGLLPCGMVYAALFYAMLSADPGRGALIMLGFGLGTLPAVTAAALGAGRFLALARSNGVRRAVGAGLVLLGVLSAAIPWRTIAMLCGIPLE